MGNLCGKSSSTDDAFSTPGRTVGAAPASGPRIAAVPKKNKTPKVGGPAHTLGGGSEDTQTPEEARRRAAEAAEARATKGNGKGGKLAASLAAQKRQSRVDTLQEASAQNVAHRESDADAKIRQYD